MNKNLPLFSPFPIADPDEQRALVVEHIRLLLEREDLQGCYVILAVESNLGVEADHHESYILAEKLNNQVCVLHATHHAGAEGAMCGLRTTNRTKHQMAFLSRWDLQQDRLRVANDVTCVGSNVDTALRELRSELTVYSRLVEPSPKEGGNPRIVFTGKHAGTTDDLAIAFQLYWMAKNEFYSNQGLQKYADFHAR